MAKAFTDQSVATTELLGIILNAVGDPMFVKDREHRFVMLNDACCKLLGVEPETLIGRTSLDGDLSCEVDLHPGSDEGVFATGEDHLSEQTLTDARGQTRTMTVRKSFYQNSSGVPYLVGVLRDVTERRQAVKLLLHQAFHDGLTGLGNRAFFERCLRKAIEHAQRSDRGLAVLCLDVDRFTAVNDTLGYRAGDRLLAAVSRRLQSVLRMSDRLARLSGDEFACLVENCEKSEDAVRVAERIHEAFRRPFEVDGTPVQVTVTLGVAWSPGQETSEDLLRFSDVALHRAKRTGQGTQVFDAGIDAAATRRLHACNELAQALQRGEFVLYYQPLVDMESGRVCGVEALLRWNHPDRGLIPPDEFIPLAEETGLIVPLGDWVLQEACRQAMRWKWALGPGRELTMSVNVSAKQLRDSGFAARAREILQETGMPAGELVLELTENVLLQEMERARELRDLGVRLAIDDFGTGYASLAYLRELPVSMLKIARPFISKLGLNVVDTSLVNTILMLGQDLGLLCVAEGIEELKQANLLRELRCHFGQGYLFAKPMPAADFEKFAKKDAPVCRLAPPPALAPVEELLLQSA
jgi:diguanylate cyclase (GGDEF)-like protein/PAS domain S-box-containing protein